MKASKQTVSKARTRAWKLFSKYIRTKDSFNGYNRCVTCCETYPIGELNAGHYIHGKTKRSYFEPRNVHPQCPRCNLYLNGNPTSYALYLEAKYGIGILQQLHEVNLNTKPWKIQELNDIHDFYKELL